jgi:hypothetical protein
MIAALMQRSTRYAVKGIEGLYIAGQWAEAWGGITTARNPGRRPFRLSASRMVFSSTPKSRIKDRFTYSPPQRTHSRESFSTFSSGSLVN